MLEFLVLGPPEVRRDGDLVPVPGGRQRALLALLLAEHGRTVNPDRAIAHLWRDGELPAYPANALQQCVAKLRKAIAEGTRHDDAADDPILTRDGGYALELGPAGLDALSLERLVAEARPQIARDPARAVELLRVAASLWRGSPFGPWGESEFLAGEAARLTDLYLTGIEDRGEAELALGRERTVAAEFSALVARHPFRERLWAHLMLALYRLGRQKEALEAFRRARRRFLELGIEPGPALRDLERRILLQDAALHPSDAPAWRAPRNWSVYPLLDAASRFTGSLGTDAPEARLGLLVAITEAAGIGPAAMDLERWRSTLGRIDGEIDAALRWSLESSPELGLRLAVASCLWWDWRGAGEHEAGTLRSLLAAAPAESATRAEALTWLAFFEHELGYPERALGTIEDAHRIARRVGDHARVGGAAAVASILARESSPGIALGHAERAVHLLSRYGSNRERGYALVCRALALIAAGQADRAMDPADEAAVTYAEAGDLRGGAWVAGVRAAIAAARGDRTESARLHGEARDFAEALDDEATRRWIARIA